LTKRPIRDRSTPLRDATTLNSNLRKTDAHDWPLLAETALAANERYEGRHLRMGIQDAQATTLMRLLAMNS